MYTVYEYMRLSISLHLALSLSLSIYLSLRTRIRQLLMRVTRLALDSFRVKSSARFDTCGRAHSNAAVLA